MPQKNHIQQVLQINLFFFSPQLQRMRRKLAEMDINSSVEAVTWDGVTFESFCNDNLWTQGEKSVSVFVFRSKEQWLSCLDCAGIENAVREILESVLIFGQSFYERSETQARSEGQNS